MSVAWLVSLLWARKLIVLTATVASLLGGLAVMVVAPPRYLATARVVLEFVKPDPITGRYLSNAQAQTYVQSQLQRTMDYQVAVPAAEALGWLDNPDMLAAYAGRSPGDRRPYQIWVADRILATMSVRMLPGSNIMSIGYRSDSPEQSRIVADVLRQAYIESAVTERRSSAMEQADAIANQIPKLQEKLADLEKQSNEYSKETGVILTRNAKDLDDLRLQRMVSGDDAVVLADGPRANEAAMELAVIEAEIAAEARVLGPNNPRLQQMQAQRDLIRVRVEAERAAASSSAGALAAEGRARDQRMDLQKAKVLDQSDKVLQLRLYHDEIDRYRKALSERQSAIAALRQLGTSTAAGVSPIGAPEADPEPVFPKPALVLGGSGGLGFLLGCFLGLLAELVHRRVRSAHDLRLAASSPMLGEVPFGGRRLRLRAQSAKLRPARAEPVPA
ncbi:Wzz/FepE/Etk N-terminal domain-containing protein [Phenylobacterium sp. SCN 70-31]|uniref:GumC family protein n=1 Tax=Phenylobacterium sp. SCN 70-31 TaxID=1660129 RepID=UPI00086EC38A|nr:Wzz/FepE/Etk N-terminal domain-containing protein [Phenylobacterium sp. SCN 70-31]ODT87862.1 MAG: hypothetical protein ABS78_09780 [Phenylobacterium sp. SCN 70-31]